MLHQSVSELLRCHLFPSLRPYLRVAHPHCRAVDLERHEELLDGAADLAERRGRLRGRFRCSVRLAGGGEEVELAPELRVPYALWEAVLVKPNSVENLGTPKLKNEIACLAMFPYLLEIILFFAPEI